MSDLRLVKLGEDYYNPDKVIGLFKVHDGTNLLMDGDGDNNWWHIKEDIDILARKLVGG